MSSEAELFLYLTAPSSIHLFAYRVLILSPLAAQPPAALVFCVYTHKWVVCIKCAALLPDAVLIALVCCPDRCVDICPDDGQLFTNLGLAYYEVSYSSDSRSSPRA